MWLPTRHRRQVTPGNAAPEGVQGYLGLGWQFQLAPSGTTASITCRCRLPGCIQRPAVGELRVMFERVVLLLAVVMFAGFGGWLLLDPGRLDVWLGIRAERLEGRTELRAFYGGLEIGLATFLLLSAFRPAWQAPALALLLAINLAIAGARCYGFFVDGSFSGKLLAFLAVELGFAAAALLALLRLPASTT